MSKLRDAAQQALEALIAATPVKAKDPQMQADAIVALRAALAEPAEQEAVAWEWRWFDTSPYTVTSGQWSGWTRVEPRNSLCTLDDALNEFRAYIANGLRYELRAIYTAPQPAIPPGYKLVPIQKLVELKASIHGDCFRGTDWELETISTMLAAAPEAPQPAKPAEQEPVAWWHRKSNTFTSGNLVSNFAEWTPLYTAPQPKREPLTDEEIDNTTRKQVDDLLDHIYEYGTAAEGIIDRVRAIARAIEAAVWGEKT